MIRTTPSRCLRLGVGLLALTSGFGTLTLLGAGPALADTCAAGPATSTQTGDGCTARATGTDNAVQAQNDRGTDGPGDGVGTAVATARGTGNRVQAFGVLGGRGSARGTGTGTQVVGVGFLDGRGDARAHGTNSRSAAFGVQEGNASASARGRDAEATVQVIGAFQGVGIARDGGVTRIDTRTSSAVARSRDGGTAGVRDADTTPNSEVPLGVSCTGRALALNRTTGEYCVSNARRTVRRDADGTVTSTPTTTQRQVLVSLRTRR